MNEGTSKNLGAMFRDREENGIEERSHSLSNVLCDDHTAQKTALNPIMTAVPHDSNDSVLKFMNSFLSLCILQHTRMRFFACRRQLIGVRVTIGTMVLRSQDLRVNT